LPKKIRLFMFDRAPKIAGLLATGVCLIAASVLFAAVPAPGRQAFGYTLTTTPGPRPEGLGEPVAEHVREEGLTVIGPDGEPLMDLWFARQIPGPKVSSSHPGVMYANLPEGVVLAVMRLHRVHRDFRDQAVPAGTYVVRYLRQPDDGDHLGETTFRDFGALTRIDAARSVGPQDFEVTLEQALQLNTHPLVWGLWPGDYVVTPGLPAIASYEAGKWAVKLPLLRTEGDPLMLAMVVVGSERIYD